MTNKLLTVYIILFCAVFSGIFFVMFQMHAEFEKLEAREEHLRAIVLAHDTAILDYANQQAEIMQKLKLHDSWIEGAVKERNHSLKRY